MTATQTATLMAALLAAAPTSAQDMEPKAYSASPIGANFLVVNYSWASGDVLFDPTLPLTDVRADVQGLALGVGHSFNLLGDLGLVTFALPSAWLDATGNVREQATKVTRSGLADARLKLSVNLFGNPAATPTEFARRTRHTIVGTSLLVTTPTGQYDRAKLINVGTNRWAFKPEVGVSIPRGPFDIDGYVGAWLFTTNRDFFPGGLTRTQDAIVAIQGHVSYTVRPRLWVAVDSTWYHGGSAVLEDGAPSIPVSNSRLGVTMSLPAGKRYSLKVAYGGGVAVRTGTDFRTVAIAWQALWLSPRWSGR